MGLLGVNLGPTWGQHALTGANVVLAKPEKSVFRLDGNTIFRYEHQAWSSQANPTRKAKNEFPGRSDLHFGMPLDALGDAWERQRGRQASPQGGPSQERPTQGKAKAEMASQHGQRGWDPPGRAFARWGPSETSTTNYLLDYKQYM